MHRNIPLKYCSIIFEGHNHAAVVERAKKTKRQKWCRRKKRPFTDIDGVHFVLGG